MPYRLGWLVVVTLLAAGCAAPSTPTPVVDAQTDVWFMQHMVPHLRQTVAVASLTRDQLTHPGLARLADEVIGRGQADIDRLQGWLDQRGLSPHGHSHQRVDRRSQTDLERLSRLRGATLDLAFARVMAARSRASGKLAATEAHHGRLPEVRQFARRLAAEQQLQIRQLGVFIRGPRRPGGDQGQDRSDIVP